jgi:hypothetical protein
VIGDPRWLPGYWVLLTDNPGAERLWAFRRQNCWLPREERWRDETTALGDQHDALRASIMHYLTAG